MAKGWSHHRNGGPDPTELELTVQPVIHRPTGGRHTGIILPQPVMCAGLYCVSNIVGGLRQVFINSYGKSGL